MDTYYFATTTLSTSGLESAYSSEISYTVPNVVPGIQVTPGKYRIWDGVGGDERDEPICGAECGDGDVERERECERAVQCGVGGELQFGGGADAGGGGGVQSVGGEQLYAECEFQCEWWNGDERDGERECDQCSIGAFNYKLLTHGHHQNNNG